MSAHEIASEVIRRWSRVKRPRPGCAVFDIDGTLLQNDEVAMGEDFDPATTTASVADCTKVPTPRMRDVHAILRRARDAGLRIILLTARREDPYVRTFTVKQLRHVGLGPDFYDSLIMTPQVLRDSAEGVFGFKKECRRHLSRLWGPVVLNVGDMWTDLLCECDAKTLEKCEPFSATCGAEIVTNPSMPLFGVLGIKV